jgi:hypothetical protein
MGGKLAVAVILSEATDLLFCPSSADPSLAVLAQDDIT